MSADALLRKLRKLESNMICPNCETKAPVGVGFGNVCVKFKTFVCDLCKTSHQAISHRVKSISMSNWTMEEVNELTDQMGGGNAAATHIWLGKAPPCGQRYPGGARPKAGDRIEIFKQFVLDAYEYGKFRADSPYVPNGSSATTVVSGSVSAPSPVKRAVSGPSTLESGRLPKPAASVASATLKSNSSFDHVGNVSNNSFDPFQTSSSNGNAVLDPFAEPSRVTTKAPPVKSSVAPTVKKVIPNSAPNLLEFADDAPTVSTKSSNSASLLDDFNSLSFGVSAPSPVPNQPPAIQPPVPPAAPPAASFDPFGADLLTPTASSGSASPVRVSQTHPTYPVGTNYQNPGFNNNMYNNPSSMTGTYSTPNMMGQQRSMPTSTMNSGYNTNSNSSSQSNILDLFSGMTYDASTSNSNGLQSTSSSASNWAKSSPMMHTSSAISQIDVFANSTAQNPSYPSAMHGNSSGRWNTPPPQGGMPYSAPPAMRGGMSMNNGNTGMMMRGNYSIPNPTASTTNAGSDKFDFLQDTMRQHLQK